MVGDYAFAIPNGMQLAGGPASRGRYMNAMKRRGLMPGVSDIFLSLPRGDFHGLYLELKHGKNTPTAEQNLFQHRMASVGYKTAVAYDLPDAKEIVGKYLKL